MYMNLKLNKHKISFNTTMMTLLGFIIEDLLKIELLGGGGGGYELFC